MSWALVQNPAKATGTGTSLSLSFGSNTTAGNLLTAEATSSTAQALTFSETAGSDTWSNDVAKVNGGSNAQAAVGHAANAAGGAVTVKVAPASGSPALVLSIQEWSGGAASSPLDLTASANGNSAAPASGSVTPTQAGELFVGCVCTHTSSTVTDETGWTNLFSNASATPTSDGEYFTASDASAQNATWTLGTSGTWAAVVASFKPAATGLPPRALIVADLTDPDLADWTE